MYTHLCMNMCIYIHIYIHTYMYGRVLSSPNSACTMGFAIWF